MKKKVRELFVAVFFAFGIFWGFFHRFFPLLLNYEVSHYFFLRNEYEGLMDLRKKQNDDSSKGAFELLCNVLPDPKYLNLEKMEI